METLNLNTQLSNDIHFDYEDKYILLLDNIHQTQQSKKSIINESHIIIMLVEEGLCRAHFNDEEHIMEKGDIVFCAPGNFIKEGMVSIDFRSRFFILSSDGSEEVMRGTHFSLSHHLSKMKIEILHLNDEEIKVVQNFYNLIASYKNFPKDEILEHIINRIIQSFAYSIASFFLHRGAEYKKPSGTAAEIIFHKFVKMLKKYPDGRSVQFYAEKLNITPKYLNTICKQISGSTSSQLINTEIVNLAMLMLKNNELSIKEISSTLGFVNQSHFGSFMRRETGSSPLSIRKKK